MTNSQSSLPVGAFLVQTLVIGFVTVLGASFCVQNLVIKTCPSLCEGLVCIEIVFCQSSSLFFCVSGARRRCPRIDSISVFVSISGSVSVSVSTSASVSVFVVICGFAFVFVFRSFYSSVKVSVFVFVSVFDSVVAFVFVSIFVSVAIAISVSLFVSVTRQMQRVWRRDMVHVVKMDR